MTLQDIKLQTCTEVQNTVAHELIHAYDNCRNADLDFSNCRHHACSEVRAANLSGDCSFLEEFQRGNISLFSPSSWRGHLKRCVRRRAALSVALNPRCGGAAGAKVAVDAVFDECVRDTAPFEKVP
eukprot:gene2843-17745_t